MPGQSELSAMLDALPGQPGHISLGVIDPLVFSGEWCELDDLRQHGYDELGYSSYARVISTLLFFLRSQRDIARKNTSAIRHFYALTTYAKDVLDVPSVSSPAFSINVDHAALKELCLKADQLATYLLADSSDETLLTQVAISISEGKTNADSPPAEQLLHTLTRPESDNNRRFRDSRVLRQVLQHLFASASKIGADAFLTLARKIEKSGEFLELFGYERVFSDRYQFCSPTCIPCNSPFSRTVCARASSARAIQE